jgi:hypothetical protein
MRFQEIGVRVDCVVFGCVPVLFCERRDPNPPSRKQMTNDSRRERNGGAVESSLKGVQLVVGCCGSGGWFAEGWVGKAKPEGTLMPED